MGRSLKPRDVVEDRRRGAAFAEASEALSAVVLAPIDKTYLR